MVSIKEVRKFSIKVFWSKSICWLKIQIAPVGVKRTTVASRMDRGVDVGIGWFAGRSLVDSMVVILFMCTLILFYSCSFRINLIHFIFLDNS